LILGVVILLRERDLSFVWDDYLSVDPCFVPDKWQSEVLSWDGNVVIRAGRQVGKTEVISRKAVMFALKNSRTTVLILAASQRQSSLLFEKCSGLLGFANDAIVSSAKKKYAAAFRACTSNDKKKVFFREHSIFVDTPSQTKILLRNGSRIYSLPAGKTGVFIRGYTLDLLILDEAAYIPDSVWLAVKPMVAVSKKMRGFGNIIMLSTPFGKSGFFYDAFHDDDFRSWHISSESCDRIPKDFLKKEKSRLSKVEYAQEYLGDFVDEFNQFFPTNLVRSRMTFESWDGVVHKDRKYFLGVDFARYGSDETAFVVSEMWIPDGCVKPFVRIVYVQSYAGRSLTDSAGRILRLHGLFHFSFIFVDDHGVGGGITDFLVEKLGKLIVPLNNAKRTLDKSGRKGKLFKEDLYSNALTLLESNPPRLDLVANLRLLRSLRSITFSYTSDRNVRIYGNYDHIAEAFVRACWCVKAKALKLFIL
jgi:hypothetical protein